MLRRGSGARGSLRTTLRSGPARRASRYRNARCAAPRRQGEACAGGDHGWPAGVDGVDDLARVDSLQVDRGHAEVAVSELALDDVERDALAGELDRVRVPELCGTKRRRMPVRAARRRSAARAAEGGHARPQVRPLMTQNSGPTGIVWRAVTQGLSCSKPQSSMPTSRRRPPLPQRTRIEPRRGSRSSSVSPALRGCAGRRARARRSGRAPARRADRRRSSA